MEDEKDKNINDAEPVVNTTNSLYHDGKGFAKGNPGRPKGAVDKTTKTVKETIAKFVEDKMPEMYSIWDTLTAKEKAVVLINFAKLIIPKEDSIAVTDNEVKIILTERKGKTE